MSIWRIGAAFYLTKLYSILTGALFILVITRNLSVADFGAWSTISSLLSYAAVLTLVNYWATRLRASGVAEATLTALSVSSALSVPALIAYVSMLQAASRVFDLPLAALAISAAYVPLLYANSSLYSSALGARPLAAAASEAAFETAKLTSAVAMAFTRDVNLEAALLSVLVGHFAQLTVLLWSLRSDFGRGPSLAVAKRILSLTPVNAVSLAPPLIGGMDVLLLSALVSNEAVAYYTIVLPFVGAISYSYFLARGLYPVLLAGSADKERLLEEALRLVTLLAIPSAVGVAVNARFLLFALKPEYSSAHLVLTVSALSAAVSVVGSVLSDTVQGAERRDIEGARPGEVLRTKIFRVQLLACARAALGVASIALIAHLLKEPLTVAALSRAAWLVLSIMEASILATWAGAVRILARVSSSVPRLLAAAVVSSAVAYILHPLKLRELAAAAALAAVVYFAMVYALDPWFRDFTSSIARGSPPEEGSDRAG